MNWQPDLKWPSFKIIEGRKSIGKQGEQPCLLTEDICKLCSCTWHRYEESESYNIKLQHGENHEQALIVLVEEQRSPHCTAGHIASVCKWAAKVILYQHGPRVWIDGVELPRGSILKVTVDGS